MALKWLRDNLKSLAWVLWIVIFVFIGLVFFEWGGVNRAPDSRGVIAAVVGDEQVTYGEFEDEYRNLESFYRQTFGEQFNAELAKQLNLPVQALDRAINRKILLMEARRAGLRATDQEVGEMILTFPVFQDENGKFVGEQKYEEFVRRGLRTTVEAFEESIRDEVVLGKLDDLLSRTAYVSATAVEKAYREEVERAKIRFIQLPAAEFSDEVTVGDTELESFFADTRDDYEIPAQRIASYLLLDTAELRREIEIPEEELRAYYEDNSADFERPEQVQARHILIKVTPDQNEADAEQRLLAAKRRIEGGEDFAVVAAEVSEDEGSASRGGDLGNFGRGSMVKPFEDAAFNAEIGQLVGPIRTDFGYHLIEVQARQPGGVQPFEQAKVVARARLLGERVEEIAESKIRDVAQQIETKELTTEEELRQLAEAEGLKFETTEPFGRNDVIPGIGRVPAFSSAAFDLEVGEISEPVQISRGWSILRLQEARDPRLPELDEVRERVQADLKQQKMAAASLARLQEVRSRLAAGEGGLDEVAGELGLEVKESNEFGTKTAITGLGQNPQLAEAALALEPGQIGGPFETAGGAVLFEVVERKTFDPEAFGEAAEEKRRELREQRLNEIRTALIQKRRRELEPQYDSQVLANFGIEGQELG